LIRQDNSKDKKNKSEIHQQWIKNSSKKALSTSLLLLMDRSGI
jgi:hypothetical protein